MRRRFIHVSYPEKQLRGGEAHVRPFIICATLSVVTGVTDTVKSDSSEASVTSAKAVSGGGTITIASSTPAAAAAASDLSAPAINTAAIGMVRQARGGTVVIKRAPAGDDVTDAAETAANQKTADSTEAAPAQTPANLATAAKDSTDAGDDSCNNKTLDIAATSDHAAVDASTSPGSAAPRVAELKAAAAGDKQTTSPRGASVAVRSRTPSPADVNAAAKTRLESPRTAGAIPAVAAVTSNSSPKLSPKPSPRRSKTAASTASPKHTSPQSGSPKPASPKSASPKPTISPKPGSLQQQVDTAESKAKTSPSPKVFAKSLSNGAGKLRQQRG